MACDYDDFTWLEALCGLLILPFLPVVALLRRSRG